MKRRGVTWIEWIVVLAICGILVAILYPVVRPRPLMFTKVLIPPLRFQNAELETVVRRLDAEMRKKKRYELRLIRWQDEQLKRRKVTVDTLVERPLKECLQMIGNSASIEFDTGGTCGTCGGPIGIPVIRHKKNQKAK